MKVTCMHCEDPVKERGLCHPCYQWERYHMKLGHGTFYMRKYSKKLIRIQRRVESRLNIKRRLRAVS